MDGTRHASVKPTWNHLFEEVLQRPERTQESTEDPTQQKRRDEREGDHHEHGEVGHGDMFGFIEVEQLVFGERTTVVVDPSEEKIKSEFEHVKRTYLPMHSIIRIDEVDKQGTSKISKIEGNVTQFPMPIYTPGDKV